MPNLHKNLEWYLAFEGDRTSEPPQAGPVGDLVNHGAMQQNFNIKTRYIMTNNHVGINESNLGQNKAQQGSFRIMFDDLGRVTRLFVFLQGFGHVKRPDFIRRPSYGAEMIIVGG